MEATELRIGNLFYKIDREQEIHIPAPIPMVVYGLSLFEVDFLMKGVNPIQNDFYKCRLSDVVGIPLSEEWLIGSGFKFGVNENNVYYKDLITIDRQLEIILSGNEYYPQLVQAPELSSEETQIIGLNKIQYVHEFQNLIYTLTGEC